MGNPKQIRKFYLLSVVNLIYCLIGKRMLPFKVTFMYLCKMRIIKEKTLASLCNESKYKMATGGLQSWVKEVRCANWNNSNELKSSYHNASIINSKRVVFNIKGNDYRLLVDIEYKLKIVFIVWFGTHTEYDKIDVKTIRYGE